MVHQKQRSQGDEGRSIEKAAFKSFAAGITALKAKPKDRRLA
jgi:hypothetical protein